MKNGHQVCAKPLPKKITLDPDQFFTWPPFGCGIHDKSKG